MLRLCPVGSVRVRHTERLKAKRMTITGAANAARNLTLIGITTARRRSLAGPFPKKKPRKSDEWRRCGENSQNPGPVNEFASTPALGPGANRIVPNPILLLSASEIEKVFKKRAKEFESILKTQVPCSVYFGKLDNRPADAQLGLRYVY